MSSYDSSFAPPPPPLIPSSMITSAFQTTRPKVINNSVTQTGTSTTAVTVNSASGSIITVSLTTAVDTTESFVVNNSYVSTGNVIMLTVTGYTGTQGLPAVVHVSDQAEGNFTLNVSNVGTAILDGAVTVSFLVV